MKRKLYFSYLSQSILVCIGLSLLFWFFNTVKPLANILYVLGSGTAWAIGCLFPLITSYSYLYSRYDPDNQELSKRDLAILILFPVALGFVCMGIFVYLFVVNFKIVF